MKVNFIGHACFMIEDGDYTIIIDPFINDNPPATVKAKNLKPTHI